MPRIAFIGAGSTVFARIHAFNGNLPNAHELPRDEIPPLARSARWAGARPPG